MTTSFARASARVLLVGGILGAMPGVALALIYNYGAPPVGPVSLDGPNLPVSLSGTHLIALPTEAARIKPLGMPGGVEVVIDNCGTFLAPNGNGQTNIPNIVSFSRYERTTDAFVNCACPGPDCFAVVPGEGYRLQVSAASSFYIVGSHAYTMMPLIGPGPASASGQNLVSLPWAVDTTLRNAEDVMRDIGFANTVNVLNFLTATDTYQAYTGRKGSPSSAFPLVDTVGYLVKVTTTQYWAPRDQASVHCEFMSGTFPAGNPDALATAFCADYAAHVPGPMSPFADFTCAKQASPPGKIKLTILGVPPNPPVPGPAVCVPPPTNYGIVFSGTTTVPHPYGYSMCCNSPLSQSMGTDGNRPVSIDFGTHDFNEFSVTTSSEGGTTTQVPALGVGWMIALVAALVAVGLWLRSR